MKYTWVLSSKQQCREIFYQSSGLLVEINTLYMNSISHIGKTAGNNF